MLCTNGWKLESDGHSRTIEIARIIEFEYGGLLHIVSVLEFRRFFFFFFIYESINDLEIRRCFTRL